MELGTADRLLILNNGKAWLTLEIFGSLGSFRKPQMTKDSNLGHYWKFLEITRSWPPEHFKTCSFDAFPRSMI